MSSRADTIEEWKVILPNPKGRYGTGMKYLPYPNYQALYEKLEKIYTGENEGKEGEKKRKFDFVNDDVDIDNLLGFCFKYEKDERKNKPNIILFFPLRYWNNRLSYVSNSVVFTEGQWVEKENVRVVPFEITEEALKENHEKGIECPSSFTRRVLYHCLKGDQVLRFSYFFGRVLKSLNVKGDGIRNESFEKAKLKFPEFGDFGQMEVLWKGINLTSGDFMKSIEQFLGHTLTIETVDIGKSQQEIDSIADYIEKEFNTKQGGTNGTNRSELGSPHSRALFDTSLFSTLQTESDLVKVRKSPPDMDIAGGEEFYRSGITSLLNHIFTISKQGANISSLGASGNTKIWSFVESNLCKDYDDFVQVNGSQKQPDSYYFLEDKELLVGLAEFQKNGKDEKLRDDFFECLFFAHQAYKKVISKLKKPGEVEGYDFGIPFVLADVGEKDRVWVFEYGYGKRATSNFASSYFPKGMQLRLLYDGGYRDAKGYASLMVVLGDVLKRTYECIEKNCDKTIRNPVHSPGYEDLKTYETEQKRKKSNLSANVRYIGFVDNKRRKLENLVRLEGNERQHLDNIYEATCKASQERVIVKDQISRFEVGSKMEIFKCCPEFVLGYCLQYRFLVMKKMVPLSNETFMKEPPLVGVDLERVKKFMVDVVEHLEAIHAAGLLHLDVKRSNVMLLQGDLEKGGEKKEMEDEDDEPRKKDKFYIIDFGVCVGTLGRNFVEISSGRYGDFFGTRGYMPSEQKYNQPEKEERILSVETDYYALGKTIQRVLDPLGLRACDELQDALNNMTNDKENWVCKFSGEEDEEVDISNRREVRTVNGFKKLQQLLGSNQDARLLFKNVPKSSDDDDNNNNEGEGEGEGEDDDDDESGEPGKKKKVKGVPSASQQSTTSQQQQQQGGAKQEEMFHFHLDFSSVTDFRASKLLPFRILDDYLPIEEEEDDDDKEEEVNNTIVKLIGRDNNKAVIVPFELLLESPNSGFFRTVLSFNGVECEQLQNEKTMKLENLSSLSIYEYVHFILFGDLDESLFDYLGLGLRVALNLLAHCNLYSSKFVGEAALKDLLRCRIRKMLLQRMGEEGNIWLVLMEIGHLMAEDMTLFDAVDLVEFVFFRTSAAKEEEERRRRNIKAVLRESASVMMCVTRDGGGEQGDHISLISVKPNKRKIENEESQVKKKRKL